jgi:hypothetical protein
MTLPSQRKPKPLAEVTLHADQVPSALVFACPPLISRQTSAMVKHKRAPRHGPQAIVLLHRLLSTLQAKSPRRTALLTAAPDYRLYQDYGAFATYSILVQIYRRNHVQRPRQFCPNRGYRRMGSPSWMFRLWRFTPTVTRLPVSRSTPSPLLTTRAAHTKQWFKRMEAAKLIVERGLILLILTNLPVAVGFDRCKICPGLAPRRGSAHRRIRIITPPHLRHPRRISQRKPHLRPVTFLRSAPGVQLYPKEIHMFISKASFLHPSQPCLRSRSCLWPANGLRIGVVLWLHGIQPWITPLDVDPLDEVVERDAGAVMIAPTAMFLWH